jgi:flagellin-like hook-associated protein FlgL
MRELAVQSASATNSTSDRANLNAEFQALNTESTRQTGAAHGCNNRPVTDFTVT